MNKKLNKKLNEIYNLLHEAFGPMHWWPAETSFEVMVGAILTQFVSWKNVETAICNLKSEGLLSIDGICSVDNEKLEELVWCTRFYKQKTKKLKGFCLHLKHTYGGNLDVFFKKEPGELRKELLSLYGVGEETADSIMLYAAGKPVFVVDAYTRRIFGRLGFFGEKASYSEIQKLFMDNLEHDVKLFNEYHALIVRVGNRYCTGKTPRCSECPLNVMCKM